MKALNTIIGSLIAVGALTISSPSQAVTAYRVEVNHATAACMGTLPVDRDMTRVGSAGKISGKLSILESLSRLFC